MTWHRGIDNHKPALSSASAPKNARIKASAAQEGTFNLSFSDKGNKFAYNGVRTIGDGQYALIFDPARKVFVLHRVDSIFNMNLIRTPNNSDAESLKAKYPQLDTTSKKLEQGGNKPAAGAKESPGKTSKATVFNTKASIAKSSKENMVKSAKESTTKISKPAMGKSTAKTAKESVPKGTAKGTAMGTVKSNKESASKPSKEAKSTKADKAKASALLNKPKKNVSKQPSMAPPPKRRQASPEESEDDDDDGGLTIEYPGGEPAPSFGASADYPPAFPPQIRRFSDFVRNAAHEEQDVEDDADGEFEIIPEEEEMVISTRAAPAPAGGADPAEEDDEFDAELANLEEDLEAELENALLEEVNADPVPMDVDSESSVSEED